MIATCPRCQSDFSWNENDAGKVSTCPVCQLDLTLPELTPEALDQLIQARKDDEVSTHLKKIKQIRNAKIAIISVIALLILMALAEGAFSKPWGGVLYGSDFESGKPSSRGYTVDGIMEGEWKGWYENGNIRRIENYKDGLLHGKQTIWREDGSKILQRTYKNGIPFGAVHYWDENGKVTSEPVYDSIIQQIFQNN